MAYYIAVRRFDPKIRKTVYEKKSKAFKDEWDANVFLKKWKSKHPREEFRIIKE